MSRLVDGSITCFSRYQPVRWSSLACPRLPTPMCTFPPTFLYVLFVYDSSANECLRNFCGDTLPAHWLREFGTVATGASEFRTSDGFSRAVNRCECERSPGACFTADADATCRKDFCGRRPFAVPVAARWRATSQARRRTSPRSP